MKTVQREFAQSLPGFQLRCVDSEEPGGRVGASRAGVGRAIVGKPKKKEKDE